MSTPKQQGGAAKKSVKKGRAAKPATEKLGQQKRVASPRATGHRGVSFEHRVQATRLIAMCLGMPCQGLSDDYSIVKLTFQARLFEHSTDDLVVDAVSLSGEVATVRMQMKSQLRPTSKNEAFREAVGLAWRDFSAATFRRNTDTTLIVYDTASAQAMASAVEVSKAAIGSSDSADWHKRVHAEHYSNNANREAFAAIKLAAETHNQGPIALDELHQFVRHLQFLHHDLDSDSTTEVASKKELLFGAGVRRDETGWAWSHIVQACASLNGTGADVTLENVADHIGRPLSNILQAARVLRQQRDRGEVQLAPLQRDQLEASLLGTAQLLPAAQPPAGPAFSDPAPAARATSANQFVTRALDAIEVLRKAGRYVDALEQLRVLGHDMKDFDDHQRARWFWFRGICKWFQEDDVPSAAQDLLRAADLSDDEDKLAAARIQGHLLLEDIDKAAKAAESALARYPMSLAVWTAAANARIARGERITPADIPKEHEDNATAWLIVANSQERAGDLIGAFVSAQTSLTKSDATFFSRDAMLRFALEMATKDGLSFGYRMVEEAHRGPLNSAIEAFADRPKVLWTMQSRMVLVRAIAHLGYAYLMLGRPKDAVALLDEARSHGVTSSMLARVEMESLRDVGRATDGLAKYEGELAELAGDALVSFAQIAHEMHDLARVDAAFVVGMARTGNADAEQLKRTLRLIRWEALLFAKGKDVLATELDSAAITADSASIPDLMFAVRAIGQLGRDPALRTQLLDRVAALASTTEDKGEVHMGAKLLFHSGRLEAAAAAFARVLQPTAFSDLHVELLYCYLKTGQRAKAHELLRTMAPRWRESDDARHIAMDLAQMAGDWAAVAELADLEVALRPGDAQGWMLTILAAINLEVGDVQAVIGLVPELLDATPQESAKLASAEMRHGHLDKGLRRIYRARRLHMGEVEAAALHLTAITLNDVDMPVLDVLPAEVGPGTSVVLMDDEEKQHRVTFDPAGMDGLPVTSEFMSDGTGLAAKLYGLKVGERVVIPQTFDDPKTLRVIHIQSAYRRLIESSWQAIGNAITPSKYMAAMSLPEDANGNMDLAKMQRKLESHGEYAAQTLDAYRDNPATLGILAKLLNRDLIDVIRGWPPHGPKLEVSSGTQPLEEVQSLLAAEKAWVIDLGMLTELALLGHLDLLQYLPKVYVASATYDALTAKLEKEAVFRKSGTMFTHEGRLGFIERTEADWKRDQDFLRAMVEAIKAHCTVVPAYGPIEVSTELHKTRKIASHEEYGALLVCLEQGASLLSLDARFRMIAGLFGVKGAWPQELLYFMTAQARLKPRDYSLAVITMIVTRRAFVCLRWPDLLFMMMQGGAWPTQGINALRTYLCDPALNFGRAWPVILNFLCWSYQRGNCEFGVVLELIEYLVEPLLRHPERPRGWILQCLRDLWDGLMTLGGTESSRFITEFVRRAAERAKHPMKPVQVKATVLHFMGSPLLRTGDLFNDSPLATERASVEQQRSPPAGNLPTTSTE